MSNEDRVTIKTYQLFKTFSLLVLLLITACSTVSPNALPLATQATTSTPFLPGTATPTLTITPTVTVTPIPSATPTATAVPCQDTKGRVERIVNESNVADPNDPLVPPLTFTIYLPPCYGFEEPGSRYPVLYMIHGQSFADDQWDRIGIDEAADELILSKEAPSFIIVMPLEADTWANPIETGFGPRVATELLPWIEQNYPVCTERTCRAIGGLSRGGAWAVRTGLMYWNLFDTIGAHSTPPFDGALYRLQLALKEIPQGQFPRIYMDMGRSDYWGQSIKEFEALMTATGIPHEWYINEGQHTEEYWSSHVKEYLQWYTAHWKDSQ